MDVDMNDGAEPPNKRPRRSPPPPLDALGRSVLHVPDSVVDVRMEEDYEEGSTPKGAPRGISPLALGLNGALGASGILAGGLLRERALTPLTPLSTTAVPRPVPPPELSPSLPSSATFSRASSSVPGSSISYTPYSGTTSVSVSTDVSRVGSPGPELSASGYTSASESGTTSDSETGGAAEEGSSGRRAAKRLKASHVVQVPHCIGDAGSHCAECAAATLTALLERERHATARLKAALLAERRTRQHHQHVADRLHGLLETSQNRLSRERAHNEAMASMWAGRVADLEAQVARLKAKPR